MPSGTYIIYIHNRYITLGKYNHVKNDWLAAIMILKTIQLQLFISTTNV